MALSHRKVGFLTCFLVLLGVIAITIVLALDVLKGPHLLKVRFNSVGTLILQEPVAMSGVQVGEVAEIRYTLDTSTTHPVSTYEPVADSLSTPGYALVTLQFYERIDLPKDSRIINFNHSMMGARMIIIERSKSSEKMDFSRVQEGYFEEGIGEMLHRAEVMLDMVRTVQTMMDLINLGTDSTQSLTGFYHESIIPFMAKYMQEIENLEKTQAVLEQKVNWALAQSEKVRSSVNTISAQFPEMLARTEQFIKTTEDALKILEQNLTQVETIMAKIQTEDNPVHKLIYEREIFELFIKMNNGLSSLVGFINDGGLSEIFSFWRNVHILGTNPTKKNKK